MTRNEVEAINDLPLIPHSIEAEASARNMLLEGAANFSPRIGDVSSGTACACVIDISGTERLFGLPQILARDIRASLRSRNLHVSIAVNASFHVARMMAASSRRITVISAGEEANAPRSWSVHVLVLPDEQAETLTLWGSTKNQVSGDCAV